MPLSNDIEELVRAEVISREAAERIKEYYRLKSQSPQERFTIVLSILGSLLAGLGVVLLVAHNWDDLPRSAPTAFSFLPLAIGQALCIFSLVRKKDSVAWRESSAVFLFFAMGSCMALISQIYHISGTLEGFIVTWLLLTAPLVYIMRSSIVSLLVIAGATWYALLEGYQPIFSYGKTTIPYLYLIFLAFVFPHYYRYFRKDRKSNFFHLHNWFLVASTIIALGGFVERRDNDFYQWIFIGYCALFGIYYLLGGSFYFRENRLFANPFLIAGSLGNIILFLLWSYDGLWNDLNLPYLSGFSFVAIGLLLVHAFALVRLRNDIEWLQDPLRWTVYVFAICVLLFAKTPVVGLVAINVWLLIIALFFIRKGANNDHLGILNFGLLIILSLALLRFFDEGIPFIWRGLFFLATGIGFFAANFWMIRKRRVAS